MATGYGATESALPAKDEDAKRDAPKAAEWESRGSVLSILVDGIDVGRQIVLLSAVFFHMRSGAYTTMLVCADPGLEQWEKFACGYTTPFVRCFPEFALAVCLLFAARNFLETRLYYVLLKHGGVLQFMQHNPWSDHLVQLLLVSYAHCIMHVVFILTVAKSRMSHAQEVIEIMHSPRPNHLPPPDNKELLGDPTKLLIDVLGFVLFPCTLFIVFLVFSYDLNAKLVPLSQYVEGMNRAEDSEDPASKYELKLLAMHDNVAKALVEDQMDALRAIAQTEGEAPYASEAVRLYERDSREYLRRHPAKVGLLGSLWGGRLVLAPARGEQRLFRAVWIALLCVITVVLLMMVSFLVFRVYHDIVACDDERIHAYPELVVEVAHTAIVLCVAAPVLQTIFWCFHGSQQPPQP